MTLAGVRVLVVEDESAVSALIEEMIGDLGCVLAGSAWRVEQGLEMARSRQFDVAVLDVNLAGEPVFPVAAAVEARGLAYVFSTGYGALGVPEAYAGAPVLAKPFREADFALALTKALAW